MVVSDALSQLLVHLFENSFFSQHNLRVFSWLTHWSEDNTTRQVALRKFEHKWAVITRMAILFNLLQNTRHLPLVGACLHT